MAINCIGNLSVKIGKFTSDPTILNTVFNTLLEILSPNQILKASKDFQLEIRVSSFFIIIIIIIIIIIDNLFISI